MTRTKKALKIVTGSFINQFAIILIGLVLPPLIIKHYGSETNGLVNSVKQILNYFTVLSVGLGAAGQVALYKPLADNDYKKINGIMYELTSFFKKMSLFFGMFICVLAFTLPLIKNNDLSFITICSVVLICGTGTLLEFLCLQKYKILLTADQKQYIISSVNTQGLLINLFFSVILILLNANIILVQLVATFAYVVRVFLMGKKVRKIYPFLNGEPSEKKEIKNEGKALLYKSADIINNYLPMTIVTFGFGFISASIYSVYNTVFMSIGMIANIFSSGFSSMFGNIIATGSNNRLNDIFKAYNVAYRIMLFWLYTCSAILILPFISIYIKNSDGINYLIPELGIMFAMSGLFKNLRTTTYTLTDTYGKFDKKNIILNYLEVIIALVFSLVLSSIYGLVGILCGMATASLIRSLLYIIDIYKNNLRISYIYEFIKILVNIFVSCLLLKLFFFTNSYGMLHWIKNAVVISLMNLFIFSIINTIMDFKSVKYLFKKFKSLLGGK